MELLHFLLRLLLSDLIRFFLFKPSLVIIQPQPQQFSVPSSDDTFRYFSVFELEENYQLSSEQCQKHLKCVSLRVKPI